jgi:hypothetical protein
MGHRANWGLRFIARQQPLAGIDAGLKDRDDDPLSDELDPVKRHIDELSSFRVEIGQFLHFERLSFFGTDYLHADLAVPANDRNRLQPLCRYVANRRLRTTDSKRGLTGPAKFLDARPHHVGLRNMSPPPWLLPVPAPVAGCRQSRQWVRR